jgi:phosphatidylglycerophosphatase A
LIQPHTEKLRPIDKTAYLIATGCGVGFVPVAPGTFGAIEGLAIYLAITALSNFCRFAPRGQMALLSLATLLIFTVGVWASEQTCKMLALADPKQVIVDEISGQMIALTPLATAFSIKGAIAAFVLFRLFDIFKPYPIRKLEHLPSGLGVMADDALAGVFAAALIWSGQLLHLL